MVLSDTLETAGSNPLSTLCVLDTSVSSAIVLTMSFGLLCLCSHALSPDAVSGCYSLAVVPGLLAVLASLGAERGLQGVRASVVGAQAFRCPAACGIFSDQGSNLWPLLRQVDW